MSNIYEVVLYQKYGNSLEVGRVISRSFIENDIGDGINNLVPIIKDFLSRIDTTGMEEPVNILLQNYVESVDSYQGLNDLLSTMSYLGYTVMVVNRVGDDINAIENIQESMANGYILLPVNVEGMSYPLLYKGWVTHTESNVTLSTIGMEMLTKVSTPTLFTKFTNIQSLRDYYSSLVEQGDSSTFTDKSSFDLMRALGYSYAILLEV